MKQFLYDFSTRLKWSTLSKAKYSPWGNSAFRGLKYEHGIQWFSHWTTPSIFSHVNRARLDWRTVLSHARIFSLQIPSFQTFCLGSSVLRPLLLLLYSSCCRRQKNGPSAQNSHSSCPNQTHLTKYIALIYSESRCIVAILFFMVILSIKPNICITNNGRGAGRNIENEHSWSWCAIKW